MTSISETTLAETMSYFIHHAVLRNVNTINGQRILTFNAFRVYTHTSKVAIKHL